MNTVNEMSVPTVAPVPAGVIRRAGAMIYDAMLEIAVLAVATIPFIVIAPKKIIIPSEVGWLLYCAYLIWQILVIVLFFGFFWTRRGQTLGMQVWKLRVENGQGKLLSWPLVLRRLLFAALPWMPGFACLTISEQLHAPVLKLLGEGLLLLVLVNLMMARFSAERCTWHDRMSRSRVVLQKGQEICLKV